MNAEAVRARVVATLSPDANVRRAAELELKQVTSTFTSISLFAFLYCNVMHGAACCVVLCYAMRCDAMRRLFHLIHV